MVGGVVTFGQEFGYGHEFVALSSHGINNLWQGFGGVLGAVVHQDDASVLKFGGNLFHHLLRGGDFQPRESTLDTKVKMYYCVIYFI